MQAGIGTKADYARHLGKSRPYITKLVKQGRIPVRKDGKIDFAKADQARLDGADPSQAEGVANSSTYTKARAAREAYNAKLAQLEYEAAVKQVLPKASVEHALVDCSRVIAQQINSLVAEAETVEAAGRANGVKGVRLALKKCARDIRQNIADALTDTAGEIMKNDND